MLCQDLSRACWPLLIQFSCAFACNTNDTQISSKRLWEIVRQEIAFVIKMFRSSSAVQRKKTHLRSGFSTGTAMVAAARAALRLCLCGSVSDVVAVRLPSNCLIPIKINKSFIDGKSYWASVIKDGGDDPDVTHRAELRIELEVFQYPAAAGSSQFSKQTNELVKGASGVICLVGGEGVGVVTKDGLPVTVGEPAINPVPRHMLCQNLAEELVNGNHSNLDCFYRNEVRVWKPPINPYTIIPLLGLPEGLEGLLLQIEVQVPEGKRLAKRTLNPRLGILGGISILGTTGLVKPFSHEAYEETIESALSVAASNGCREVVLSTGGKSERFAQNYLPDMAPEAFVQIADFYAFSLKEARKMNFKGIVHSVFFGKLVKMAYGHAYTHAHKVSLDLDLIGRVAEEKGYDGSFCDTLRGANTARHALEMLLLQKASDVVFALAELALSNSVRITENEMTVRIILFNYDGTLIVDIRR